MNDAETIPLDTEHDTLESKLAGSEESVHDVSPPAKFEPDTKILAPARPEDGTTITVAVTVKKTVSKPCWTSEALIIEIERNPPSAFSATWYVPVSTP